MPNKDDDLIAKGNALAEKLGADVLFYTGYIMQPAWLDFSRLVAKRKRRDRVVLILVTPGGDPDAAFKMGRCLQEKYKDGVFTLIPGWCKSAGTLLTLASSKIYMGDLGELGPLDIQLAKPDEIDESGSGLLVEAAMRTLQATAQKMFVELVYGIRTDTRGGLTTRTAAEVSAKLVTQLLTPIYQQIDPMKIGEFNRALKITTNYGFRLNFASKILRNSRSLDYLVQSYPDHGFVIDRNEAKNLFTAVETPTSEMTELIEIMADQAIIPKDPNPGDKPADIRYLCTEPVVQAAKASPAAVAKEQSNGHRKKANGKFRERRRSSDQPAGTA
jgi:hypothetical protein